MVELTNFLDFFGLYLVRHSQAGGVKVAQSRFVNGPHVEQGACGRMNRLEGITFEFWLGGHGLWWYLVRPFSKITQALERVRQGAQRGLTQRCGFSVQRRMVATRTGVEELAGHQGVTARRDGFGPVAGGAGVGGGRWRDGHGCEGNSRSYLVTT